jgi:predicted kinase
VLVCAEAPEEELRSRIEERAKQKDEASEADLAVLEHQLASVAPIGRNEAAISVDTNLDIDVEDLVAAVLARGNR